MKAIMYASAVGSLRYARVYVSPDIAHVIIVVSIFLANPGKKHWETVNHEMSQKDEEGQFVFQCMIA